MEAEEPLRVFWIGHAVAEDVRDLIVQFAASLAIQGGVAGGDQIALTVFCRTRASIMLLVQAKRRGAPAAINLFEGLWRAELLRPEATASSDSPTLLLKEILLERDAPSTCPGCGSELAHESCDEASA